MKNVCALRYFAIRYGIRADSDQLLSLTVHGELAVRLYSEKSQGKNDILSYKSVYGIHGIRFKRMKPKIYVFSLGAAEVLNEAIELSWNLVSMVLEICPL